MKKASIIFLIILFCYICIYKNNIYADDLVITSFSELKENCIESESEVINDVTYEVYTIDKNLIIANQITLNGSEQGNILIQGINDAITITADIAISTSVFYTNEMNICFRNLNLSGGDSTGKAFYFVNSNVVLENLKISGFNNQTIYINSSNAKIKNCIISNNEGKYGTGLYNNSGNVTILESKILENLSEDASIVNESNATMIIENSTFEENVSTAGAGVITNRGNLEIKNNCKFIKNSTQKNGGVLVNIYDGNNGNRIPKVTISDSEFRLNTSTKYGAAIYNEAELEIIKTLFSENSAQEHGGAIVSSNKGNIVIDSSKFEKNNAGLCGGALIGWGTSTFNIKDSNFFENQAIENGGVIEACSEMYFYGCEFKKNKAQNGSVIASYYKSGIGIKTCTLDNCILEENDANGTIIFNSNLNILNNTSIKNNISTFGDILFNEVDVTNANIVIEDSEIITNTSNEIFQLAIYLTSKAQLYIGGKSSIPFDEKNNSNSILIMDNEIIDHINNGTEYKDVANINFFVEKDGQIKEFDVDNMKNKGEKIGIEMCTGYPHQNICNIYGNNEEILKYIVVGNRFVQGEDFKVEVKNKLTKVYDENKNLTVAKLLRDVDFFEGLTIPQHVEYSSDDNTINLQNQLNPYTFDDLGLLMLKYMQFYDGDTSVSYQYNNDFEIQYADNDVPGKATIKFIGNEDRGFCGTLKKSFDIKCDLSKLDKSQIYIIRKEEKINVDNSNYEEGIKEILENSKYSVYAAGRRLEDTEYELQFGQLDQDNNIDVTLIGKGDYVYNSVGNIKISITPVLEFKEVAENDNGHVLISNIEESAIVDIPNILNSNLVNCQISADINYGKQTSNEITKINSKKGSREHIVTYDIGIKKIDDGNLQNKQDVKIRDEVEVILTIDKEEECEYSNFKIYHTISNDNIEVITPMVKINKKNITLEFKTKSFSNFSIYADKKYKEKETMTNNNGYASSDFSIVTINHKSITTGFNNNEFRPNYYITRAEIAALLCRLDSTYDDDKNYKTYLSGKIDIDDKHWAANYLGYMNAKKIIQGTTFKIKPSDYCTRAEVVKILCSYKNLNLSGEESTFEDSKGRWYDKYVSTLQKLGYIEGRGNNKFLGNEPITRAEIIKLLCLLENREIKDINKITKSMKTEFSQKYTDVEQSKWYYPYIFEMSYDHAKDILH